VVFDPGLKEQFESWPSERQDRWAELAFAPYDYFLAARKPNGAESNRPPLVV
jgi:hypothetical protein